MGAFDDLIPPERRNNAGIGQQGFKEGKGKLRSLDLLEQQLGTVEQLYNRTLKGGYREKGFGVLREYLPSEENDEFNTAANAMLPMIRQALSTSAKDGDSDRELAVWESLVPHSSEKDGVNERRIGQLKAYIKKAREGLQRDLGMSPPQQAAPKSFSNGWSIRSAQ